MTMFIAEAVQPAGKFIVAEMDLQTGRQFKAVAMSLQDCRPLEEHV